jgi:hypothetical protein
LISLRFLFTQGGGEKEILKTLQLASLLDNRLRMATVRPSIQTRTFYCLMDLNALEVARALWGRKNVAFIVNGIVQFFASRLHFFGRNLNCLEERETESMSEREKAT